MLRVVIAAFAVLVARFLIAIVIGWLANRQGARWTHVAAVSNTVILTSVVLAIAEFAGSGFTLYSVVFTLLMVYLAYTGAQLGIVGFTAVKANEHRRSMMENAKLSTRVTPSPPRLDVAPNVLAELDRRFEELNKKDLTAHEILEALGKLGDDLPRPVSARPETASKLDDAEALAFSHRIIAEENRKLAAQGKTANDLTARENADMLGRMGEQMRKWWEDRSRS